MPRTARVVVPGFPHHVTQRGTNRQDVFFTTDDQCKYLELLENEARRYDLLLIGYCLMTNHVHLICIPQNKSSLAKALGRTHQLYAQYINEMHGRCGHLWQNRFYSCPMDEDHLWNALIYTERNPVRAQMAKRAWDYPWSSAASHAGINGQDDLLDKRLWSEVWSHEQWRQALVCDEDHITTKAIREKTSTGRPLCSDNVLSKIEAMLGGKLRAGPKGRPRKHQYRKDGQDIHGKCPY